MYQALHNSLSNYQKRCNGRNVKNMVVEYLEVQLADGQAVIGTTASQVKTQPTRMIFNLAMILGFDDVINDHHTDKSLKIIDEWSPRLAHLSLKMINLRRMLNFMIHDFQISLLKLSLLF